MLITRATFPSSYGKMLTLPHYEIIDGQFGKYCRTRLNNCQKVKLFFKSARMQFPHVWKICVLKKQITDVILIGRFSNCQSIKKGTGRHFVKDLYKDVFFVPPCLPECYLQGETKIEPDIWLIILWLLWDTSTRRSHSAQITSPRVVSKSCLIHRFLSPLLHEENTSSSTILDTWKNLFMQPHQTELSSYKEENRIHAKTSTLRL